MKIQIVHIGPLPTANGGIATVERLLLDFCSERFSQSHLATHYSSRLKTALLFPVAFLKLLLMPRSGRVVQMHMSYRGSFTRKEILSRVCRAKKIPYVIHLHGSEFGTFYHASSPSRQSKIVELFRRSASLVVLSESWEKFMRENLGDDFPVRVIYNPCEQILEPAPKSGKKRVLYAGLVGPRKGTFDLVHSFADADLSEEAVLEICGNGETEKLSQTVKDLDLSGAVEVYGWIDHDTLMEKMRRADLFVLPSYAEGLPMAILEAMGASLPVISTPVGGIAEAVIDNETGILITPGDRQALTTALQRLVRNEEEAERMGKQALKLVQERFSLQSFREQFEALWSEAVQG